MFHTIWPTVGSLYIFFKMWTDPWVGHVPKITKNLLAGYTGLNAKHW